MACLPRSLCIEDLVAFDVVPSLLSAARLSGLRELLPLQEQAVHAGLLSLAGGEVSDLLLVGGAGSGKRSICELAAAHHAHSGQRVLLVCHDRPSAARCIERFRSYQLIGLRCGLVEEASELAQFDLAVATLDSAAMVLASTEPVRCGLGLLILEDLEVVADSSDGELWPLLLLRCQALKAELPLRMLLLCADALLGEKLGRVLRAVVVRDVRAVSMEQETASLARARALMNLRGGLLARTEHDLMPAAVHAVRPR